MDCFWSFIKLLKYIFNASSLKANQEGIYIEYIKLRSKFEPYFSEN